MNDDVPSFEWDDEKDRSNIKKRGVELSIAQKAFLDPHHIIVEDDAHSAIEKRYFSFGLVETEILTARFTWRDGRIRIFGAGYWQKGKKFMNKKIEYTKGEIGKVKIVKDFLPPPSELVLRDDNVKVTLSLSRRSIDFLKAKRRNSACRIRRCSGHWWIGMQNGWGSRT